MYQNVMLYDSRITNLTRAWTCGLIGSPRVPAFDGNYITMALTQMQDQADMFELPSRNKECGAARKALFPTPQSVYNSWSWSFSTSQSPNHTYCDRVKSGLNSYCRSSMVLSYESQLIQSVRSRPGTTRLEIWLNAGSIIGGVQFFFWFLTMFSAY